MIINDHMMIVCKFRGDTARNWGRFGQILDPSLVEPAFWGGSRENPTFRVPESGVEVQGAGLGFEVEVLRFKHPGSFLGVDTFKRVYD